MGINQSGSKVGLTVTRQEGGAVPILEPDSLCSHEWIDCECGPDGEPGGEGDEQGDGCEGDEGERAGDEQRCREGQRSTCCCCCFFRRALLRGGHGYSW